MGRKLFQTYYTEKSFWQLVSSQPKKLFRTIGY